MLTHAGSDLHIARSAWVSSAKEYQPPSLAQRLWLKMPWVDHKDDPKVRGVIRALLRQSHGTPFESGYFEWRVSAPRAVRDEAVRHRLASFSSSSLRYRLSKPEVYIPPRHRPLKKSAGYKSMRPTFDVLDEQEYNDYVEELRSGYQATQYHVDRLHEIGRDETEAQRWLSHDGTYCDFIIRLNPRSLMHFLSLRTHEPEANHVSYPMWEIEQMARSMEQDFQRLYPLASAAFNEYGREAP